MTELKRVLNYPTLLIIAINSIMGTGIYFQTALGAKYAGASSIFSWIIMSLIAIYIASCFGELTGMFPKAGGVYEFAKQTYGRFPSFLIAWLAFITGVMTSAMLLVGGISYILPSSESYNIIKITIAILLLFLFNAMAYRGMKTSMIMIISFSVITLVLLFVMGIYGFFFIQPGNLADIFPIRYGAVFVAIFFIMETFFGWEGVLNLAEETNEPEKIIPKALIWSTVAISVITITITLVSIGILGTTNLANSEQPMADLALKYFGAKGQQIVILTIFIAIVGSVTAWVVSAPRLLLALTRDGLFLTHFRKIHPVYNTPSRAIVFQFIITAILVIIGAGSYNLLLKMFLPLALIMYAFVILSVPILRYTKPNYPRPFKTPFGKVGPLIIIGIFIVQIIMWIRVENAAIPILKLALSIIGIGIPLYFLISIYYDPKMISEVNDIAAYFALFTERITLPIKVRNKIMEILGDIKRKTILEYGCSVGTLTLHLAKEVGPFGKVYAVDLSKNDLKITQRRIEKDIWQSHERLHGRVLMIHDEQQITRVHNSVHYADAIVSVGMLGYIQDIRKILKEMKSILPNNGKICFVEYGDFFKIIPNVEWLNNNSEIEQIFRESGFSVQVEREKGLLWSYIYVYGIKSEKDIAFI